MQRTPEDRFWAKVDKNGLAPSFAPHLGPCWVWTASTQVRGYGQFNVGHNTMVLAHRFAYKLLIGPIPKSMELDHLCRVHACVNPAHLDATTGTENRRRGIKGALTTHCPHGHEYTSENTYTAPGTGHRQCLICRNKRNAARPKTPHVPVHSTTAGYKRGCRCDGCCEAKSAYMRSWRERTL